MDEREFEQRVRACTQKLFRICYALLPERADRDDAIQEALIKAWRRRGTLRDLALFETWLTRIAINECKKHSSAQKTRAHGGTGRIHSRGARRKPRSGAARRASKPGFQIAAADGFALRRRIHHRRNRPHSGYSDRNDQASPAAGANHFERTVKGGIEP